MIRIEHIIKRDELFQWMENPDICRIELTNHGNKGLKDKTVCKIHAFHRISISGGDHITTILGGCKKAIEDDDNGILSEKLSGVDHTYLNGIQNQIHYNWLSKSMINRLLEIQNRNSQINLGIPKKIIKLVEKYNTMKPSGKINPITKEEIHKVEEKDITFWDKRWEELTLDEKAMICSLAKIPFLATEGEFNNEEQVKRIYNVYKLRNTFYY